MLNVSIYMLKIKIIIGNPNFPLYSTAVFMLIHTYSNGTYDSI